MLRMLLASTALLVSFSAHAAITEIRVDSVEPFAEGESFGESGPYTRIRGIAKGELDPKAPENSVIADLDKAPRNARGRVEYETDFFILKPAKSSGTMLYEVNNRGRKFLNVWIDEAPQTSPGAINDPKTKKDAGLGFSLARGWTIVWSGWDPDAPAANGLATRVPIAQDGGKPIVGRIREEIQIGTRGPGDGQKVRLSYPATGTDQSKARLVVRDHEADPRVELASDKWRFVDAQTIALTPESEKFAPIKIYEFWYEATDPKIVGIGYAATRDVVAFLRHARADEKGTPNPVLTEPRTSEIGIRHVLALGISQSGRYLRHHLELGMNKDESGRRVFDGVLAHISGAGKVFANHRFAMPGRTATQHEDRQYPENWFPYSAASSTDPFTKRTAALLKGDASDPMLIETNTSTEYWQKGASLLHIDPTGQRDLDLPANVRAYLIAGAQHGGRAGLTSAPGACANARNPHSPAPALRALLVALEDWVVSGKLPPASRVPSLKDGSAVKSAQLKFPEINGFARAPGDNPIGEPVDWISPPGSTPQTLLVASAPTHYATLVPLTDYNGNEAIGIRLPPIAAPLATYTGWNVYKAAPRELCDRDGSYSPFAKTQAERQALGDVRPSLEERYGGRAGYVARVKAAAQALVADRLLLPSDAAAYVKAAESSDRF